MEVPLTVMILATIVSYSHGVPDSFEGMTCMQGNDNLTLTDIPFASCTDKCRTRDWCTGVSYHVGARVCVVHGENATVRIKPLCKGFVFSHRTKSQKAAFFGSPEYSQAKRKCSSFGGMCKYQECSVPSPYNDGIFGNQRLVGAKISYMIQRSNSDWQIKTLTCLPGGTWNDSRGEQEQTTIAIADELYTQETTPTFTQKVMSKPEATSILEATFASETTSTSTEVLTPKREATFIPEVPSTLEATSTQETTSTSTTEVKTTPEATYTQKLTSITEATSTLEATSKQKTTSTSTTEVKTTPEATSTQKLTSITKATSTLEATSTQETTSTSTTEVIPTLEETSTLEGTLTPEATTAPVCQSGWIARDRSCYLIGTDAQKKPRSEAKKFCNDLGAHFVVPNTEEENNFIKSQLKGPYGYWVGFYRGHKQWRTADRSGTVSMMDYDDWKNGKPWEYGCIFYKYHDADNRYSWDIEACDSEMRVICEKSALA